MVWLLNVKLGAVQSTYMAKLEIENWSAAYRAHFPQHIVRNSAGTLRAWVRIIPCAFHSI